MSAVRTYDPGEYLISFAGIQLTAIGPDTFIAAARNEEGWTPTVGAGGEVARTRNRNTMGRVTVTLLQTSPENAQLSAIAQLDAQTGEGIGALFIKDRIGQTVVHADQAWIVKKPDVTRAKVAGVTEWLFECGSLDTFSGGNVFTP
jgi:hypothetical protein